jgi:hypothetical protein
MNKPTTEQEPIEEIVARIRLRDKQMLEIMNEQMNDLEKINDSKEMTTDLITVAAASEKYHVSTSHLYDLLNCGDLERHERKGKIYISRKEYEGRTA